MDSKKIVIEYTRTAKETLRTIASFLQITGGDLKIISDTLAAFELKAREFPLGSQICPELLNLGCAKYRECNTEQGFRVIYSVDNNLLTVHAVLALRQDIKQLLFKRLIQP